MSNQALEYKISQYHQWRMMLADTITTYRDWLVRSDCSNSLQELRLTDFVNKLRKDRLVLALVAEFSRGKTETINALFFANYDQRLLPSEAGRTTMCPTEILWDEDDEPCIKLLPIETRQNEDSLAYYKNVPQAWKKFRLDLNDPDSMRSTLRKLAERKDVSIEEAIKLGLWTPKDPSSALQNRHLIEVPVWRHAIVNFPHPLLKDGLIVIDTPGLNALGTEPELTHKIIPNAHAVLFITATDTGVTQSDMQIWNEYIRDQAKYKLVVLNKIDVLWDDLKSASDIASEIDRQVSHTAHELMLPKQQVFTVSAQKGLLAKIKKDDALLKRSGIDVLERALSQLLIESKLEIIGTTVAVEVSGMIKASRKLLQVKIDHARTQFNELKVMLDQHQSAFGDLLASAQMDKQRYQASLPVFVEAEQKINRIGKKLLRHLSLAYLESAVAENKREMKDSWTTMGLNQGMKGLMKQANELAIYITTESNNIRRLAHHIYDVFRTNHGFEISPPPPFDMKDLLGRMEELDRVTKDFCNDPINLLTEKRFLIRRFFVSLGSETQRSYQDSYNKTERWIYAVINNLRSEIEAHKQALDLRHQGLLEAKNSAENLHKQLNKISAEHNSLVSQAKLLDDALLKLMKATHNANLITQQKAEREQQMKSLSFEGLQLPA